MTVPHNIIEKFVDAAVQDAMLADELLLKYPDLRTAIWFGESILRFLAIENYSEGVYYLVRRGWNVDEADNFGNTILIDSVMAKAHDSVIALLELGANPNYVTHIGETIFHILPQNSNKNARIRLLLVEKGIVEKT
jgi:ankyrin repeat protein